MPHELEIRFGKMNDLSRLQKLDHYVGRDWVKRCLEQGEYIIATNGSEIIGFLRFSMFWGTIPYMDLVWILSAYRRQSIGSTLFGFWENEMKSLGAKILMTSSMSDEPEPQT